MLPVFRRRVFDLREINLPQVNIASYETLATEEN